MIFSIDSNFEQKSGEKTNISNFSREDAGNVENSENSKKSASFLARNGRLAFGDIKMETPIFMPVGTQATVKTLHPDEIWDMGYRLILANTYHLSLRPGSDLIRDFGGVASFMGWNGAILTDSGGFQVFSLSALNKISEEGVSFRSHHDGRPHFLTPENSMEIQDSLGSDIVMAFDQCTSWPCDYEMAKTAVGRTTRWARRCKESYKGKGALFGIVQGSTFRDLREQSAQELVAMDFDGYAIGGLSVGEPASVMMEVLSYTLPLLPRSKPRYLMGVGSPLEMLRAIALGIDMMDCVLPTRLARHGAYFTKFGRINIKSARFERDSGPIEEGCDCPACRRFSRAYIRHLYRVQEGLALRLGSLHNLYFLKSLADGAQTAIKEGNIDKYINNFQSNFEQEDKK